MTDEFFDVLEIFLTACHPGIVMPSIGYLKLKMLSFESCVCLLQPIHLTLGNQGIFASLDEENGNVDIWYFADGVVAAWGDQPQKRSQQEHRLWDKVVCNVEDACEGVLEDDAFGEVTIFRNRKCTDADRATQTSAEYHQRQTISFGQFDTLVKDGLSIGHYVVLIGRADPVAVRKASIGDDEDIDVDSFEKFLDEVQSASDICLDKVVLPAF
jgi:hypothetical protein